ncbi:MAG: TnpV protein [Eubacteriales bacterium]|nr:TnpV protein [Eubacteriales bacterium]
MDKYIVDEKTRIPYTLVVDYYLPWGDLPDEETEQRPIGIWGQRHLRYIKKHRKALYIELLISGKLNDYLAYINDEAVEMFSRMVKEFAEKEGITETLKASNQMEWVGRMNNIQNCAKEIVCTELIFN